MTPPVACDGRGSVVARDSAVMTCGMLLDLEWEPLSRIVRSDNLTDTVHVEDRVEIAVRMLPLLAGDAMGATLKEVLATQGWETQADGSMTRVFGEATATLDAGATTVTLRRAGDVTVTASGSAVVKDGDEKRALAKANTAAERALEQERKRAEAKIEADNAAALTKEEPAVRAALQEALNRVYRQALEERARQLGEVESVDERGDVRGGYEVTVVVKA